MEKYENLNEQIDKTLIATTDQDTKFKPTGSTSVFLISPTSQFKKAYFYPLDSVQAFKIRFFELEIQQNYKIRLIFKGRELKDQSRMSSFQIKQGSFLHLSIVQAEYDHESLMSLQGPYLGFNRFNSHYTQQDLSNLKFHFHQMCSLTGFDPQSQQAKLELEQEWLQNSLPIINSNIVKRNYLILEDLHRNGDKFDFIFGFLFGILFSVFSLFFVKFTQIFLFKGNIEKKKGVILGIFLEVWIGLIIFFKWMT